MTAERPTVESLFILLLIRIDIIVTAMHIIALFQRTGFFFGRYSDHIIDFNELWQDKRSFKMDNCNMPSLGHAH